MVPSSDSVQTMPLYAGCADDINYFPSGTLKILSHFSYQLERRAGKLHENANGLSRQTPCLDCTQWAAVENQDGKLSRPDIEAEMQQIGKIQAEDLVA